MNKTELIAEISESVNMNKRAVECVLAATLESITNAMLRGDTVQLFGFGTFEVKDRAPRTGRNPKSGNTVHIAASRSPVFRPAAALKQAVKTADKDLSAKAE